ncbi:MAG TPA: serine hydrolase domain-containing protein [Streptosporangiaceae bacterium]|jgi:CubicO group peptidase (beta-lactamase class C family)
MTTDVTQLDTDALDAVAARFAAAGGQPGLAYGIVADGSLVHTGGCGERWIGGPVPDAGTVFRIASMTKSFTATMVVLLRERGLLRLDDDARDYVPELSGLEPAAPDCPPVSIRQLLTMTAGFPSDDPWGDRQQGLDPAAFAALLADGGVRCAWAPATRFEYSNLGYAVLGKVIEEVTGTDYATAVRQHLLRPLGLDRTGFAASEFDSAELARGYRREGAGWTELEPAPHGAFAPMGGVFSCVRDLSAWVAGFAAAFPPRGADGDGHPLGRAVRREMQLAQVAVPVEPFAVRFTGPASVSYGFGLFVEHDRGFGTVVQHSGGYPGYGSQMRWHPATGRGVIVLANSTYAGAGLLARDLLAAQLRALATSSGNGWVRRGPMPAPGGPWPETLAAKDAVDELLQAWDDELADRLFAANVDLDQPRRARQDQISRLRERVGPFRPAPDRASDSESPAHCRWWLTGEHGTVSVQIRLAPLGEPLVQQLVLAIPPAPASALGHAIGVLTEALQEGAPSWPAELATDSGFAVGVVLQRLRAAAALAGPCRLDCYLAGDGETSATVRLVGRSAVLDLTVEAGDGGVRHVDIAVQSERTTS